MRGIAHPNIVRLYGVALDKEPFLIVMELMANGDLKTFLRTNRSSPYQKLCWAAHAAYGIAYMHTKYLIHRDIAARNCLLSSSLTLKIADFGLTREGGVYQMIARRKLPVKWIAPEVLENNIFTLKSDVWSFGILVWEIMSDGAVPYEGLPNVKVKEMMLQGKHNKFPPGTNAEVVKLVQTRCWMRDPASRCTMLEVAKIMARVSGVRPPPTRCLFSKELIATAKQPKMRSMKMKSATRKRNISN
ncbi:protein tyrosine kinase [Oesophagostomum dentatum]|uniref:receptor protein-tyrosine kinase n=1 Tax=Oesophagostomum dentatum TaxID=61180 RepID=A0A0B1TAK4_OESDE|nr:protein tyrosine kinase [Oesophagostomum dentatum]